MKWSKDKNSTIHLNEEELDIIVKNAVRRVLNEMSFKRKDFIDHIVGELIQVFENWCLVRFCILTGQTRYKKHWCDELYSHLVALQGFSLKKNQTYDYKYKAIFETFEKYDLFDANVIDGRISLKFRKEGIDRKSRLYSEIIDDCIKNHHKLISVISNSVNTAVVEDFISDLLGESYNDLV